MWKYNVYAEDNDVVRWAEKYLVNSDGSSIKLYDIQKSILSNKSNRKIVLGRRRSGVTTTMLIDILYNITHSDYRRVMIFTDNQGSMSSMLHDLTIRCMIPNERGYILNWSDNNRVLKVDHQDDSNSMNVYRSYIEIRSMNNIHESIVGHSNVDIYFDIAVIDSLPKIYDILPSVMLAQTNDNRLWICNTMSATAPLLHSVELHQLRIMGRGGDSVFQTIVGDI